VYLGEDLSRVPSLDLEAGPARPLTTEQWQKRKGRAVAAGLLLNDRAEDGYLKALVASRPDLKGVPFVLGGACRTKAVRAAAFDAAARTVARTTAGTLLATLAALEFKGHHTGLPRTAEADEEYTRAHVSAVRQITAPWTDGEGLKVVEYFAAVPRPEAAVALARLAVFSTSKEVRHLATQALGLRRDADYTAELVEGLRHPWPPAARNAADAAVRLQRTDLLPHLVGMLDGSDPRAPREADGKTVAHEVVRINHHKNCMLCHPPARREGLPAGVLAAEIPLPSEGLQGGYGRTESPLLVRIDVTYLRQDFSALLPVKDHGKWPEMQRFDFVVRKRVLSRAQADDLRKRLEGPSPYREAAVRALWQLTGRALGAKAEEWRMLLGAGPS
jgi:hypothetical protein